MNRNAKGLILLLLPTLMVGAVWAWAAGTSAKKTSRLSTLLVLRGELIRFADKHGRYPPSIDQAVDSEFLRTVRPETITYFASDMKFKFAEGSNARLFCEKAPARYGFTRGWFDVYEKEHRFNKGEMGEGDRRP